MKKTWLISGIIGAVLLGGAYGVSAMSDDSSWSEKDVKFTQKEAESAAKKEINGLTIDKVERDKEDGVLLYEIDGHTEEGKEMNVDLDANTGEIVKIDRDGDEDESEEKAAAGIKVKKEDAEKTAKEKAAGSEVKEMGIDDGHYEFELHDGEYEYEVTIHGQTGEVIEFEKDKED
ncbi:PepSY domain-containing protein [Halobacillus karajensis]|uniref:PepSY domain-containing protein n=1 Tax=Halobacillus karajensis TaxID=195088 RepID=A0A024P2Q0_9BACI|nr:PepSY domain-containing protein [Halobacillus karajensis]CDQ19158.1 hypothetical protein BN982_01442 [Halobacillus karajensis]CDQ22768.1 hypothetical protein BN983_00984 [Halobacillus karajensis]CDQ26250.1 hypothetical protein BN981_00464 [Halobacillus karajensis]